MFSNLYKWNYISPTQEEKRVIDTNELVAKRIEQLNAKMHQEVSDGFTAGLDAAVVEVDSEFQDGEESGETVGNVIKSGENAAVLRMQAEQEAEMLLQEARAEAERIKVEANTVAMEEKKRLLSEAENQGYTAGIEKAKKEYEQKLHEVQERARKLEEEYQNYMDELEPQFIDTITGIYEHIFHVELECYRDILVYLISATMRKVDNNRNFMIHVSKEDYPYVSMQKKQISAGVTSVNTSIEIVEDMTLTKNECFIETESGIFDCSLGVQLAELGQKIRLLSYEKE